MREGERMGRKRGREERSEMGEAGESKGRER